MGKVLQSIFFGTLRPLELEVRPDDGSTEKAEADICLILQRLQERGWFAVTETLLALTIFRDEFDSTFILLFISLLFLKVFHWLAADRIELVCWPVASLSCFHD